MSIIVMGVSGCGKTTIARELAKKLSRPFIDADDVHSIESKQKMQSGQSLTDHDRLPWLQSLHELLIEKPDSIIACSALTHSYRKILTTDITACFIYLNISYSHALTRLSCRKNHFFPPSLLQSQYAILEPLTEDEPGITLDATSSISAICRTCGEYLRDKPY